MSAKTVKNAKQHLYREFVLGTLIYSVVLGFFNDYTSILSTSSYSTTFLVAVVMELLTLATLMFKDYIGAWYKKRQGTGYIVAYALTVWLIMFLSKFVFLEVLELLFSNSLQIDGFIGIFIVVICMMLAKQIVDVVYIKLADK